MAHPTDTAPVSRNPSPSLSTAIADEHIKASRRWILQAIAAGCTAPHLLAKLDAADQTEALAAAIGKETRLLPDQVRRFPQRRTPQAHCRTSFPAQIVSSTDWNAKRGNWKSPPDPESNSRLRSPLNKADGTALDFAGLMKIAETKAVRYLKVMTCNNLADPLGMGLWEGVPLREVSSGSPSPKTTSVASTIAAFTTTIPKQIFQSSLPIGSCARRSARRTTGNSLLRNERPAADRRTRRTGADDRSRCLRLQISEMDPRNLSHKQPSQQTTPTPMPTTMSTAR